jgi:hypothetical protein
MRQFAPSTINKWVDGRLYFDADDALTKPEPPANVCTVRKTASGSTCAEEVSGDLKSPKLDSMEIEYVIDVLVKECSEEVLDQLRRCLDTYR